MKADVLISKIIKSLYLILMVSCILLCIFPESVDLGDRGYSGHANLAFIFCGVVLLTSLGLIYNRSAEKSHIHLPLVFKGQFSLVCSSVIMLVFLIITTHFYYFETGWDAGTVIWNAEFLADGRISELNNDYYSIYPNNVLMTVLFSVIIKLGRLLPVGTDYYILVAFQCICMVVSSFVIYATAIALSFTERQAHFVRCIFILFAGLSPWVVIPYSDTIGMFFMVLILYLYAKNRFPLVMGILIIAGSMIKPTVFIFAIALVITGVINRWGKKRDKKTNTNIVLFIIGCVLGYLIAKSAVSFSGFELNPEKSMSPAHYLMMGLNEDYHGVINVVDQDFSLGIDDSGERIRADLDVAWSRFRDMWPGRFFRHLLRKALYSCGDGTFAWGVEGEFFQYPVWTGNERAEALFRSFYYPDGSRYAVYTGFEQMMWLGLIFFSILCALLNNNKRLLVLYLTVIGMIMFEMIFEPRARHLLLMVPIICILATGGIVSLSGRLKRD